MKIVGISGSSVKDGNNEKIIEFVLQTAKKHKCQTEKILLSQYDIKPCINCGFCRKEKGCSIKDDLIKALPILESADAIVVSSPVYFGTVTAQLKALFDRTIILRRNGFLLKNKIGAAIAVGGSRNGGQEITIQAIHAWMHIQGIIVVGDNSHFGGIVQAPFEKDDIGKKTVEDTINKVCETLSLLKKVS
jgi:multimeric flavodoxin WrbA